MRRRTTNGMLMRLAVLTNWGLQGIGTHLLQYVEQQASQHNYPKVALNVAQENKQALSLYLRLQYVVTQETILYQCPHLRMVKRLKSYEYKRICDVRDAKYHFKQLLLA